MEEALSKNGMKEVIMKQRNIRSVWLFLGLFTATSVLGLAQWRRPGTWGYPGLNLSDEQLAKIQDLRLAFQEKIMPLRLEWEKARLNAERLLSQAADQEKIDAAWETLDGIDLKLEDAYEKHWTEVRGLLDEEQKAYFDRFGGLGLGHGWGRGVNPRLGLRPGFGRGFGPGWGMRRGFRSGWAPGMGPGFDGWRRGLGRGYFCPWFRWR
jgi:hypothetical protein